MPPKIRCARAALVDVAGSEWLGRQGIPRRLEEFAERFGVESVTYRPLTTSNRGSVDAMLVMADGDHTIVVDEKSTETRRRYSIAHELAHLVVLRSMGLSTSGMSVPRYRQRQDGHSDPEEERLCDQIAAEILMPADSFIENAGKFGPSLNSLRNLANIYFTSITSTAIRFTELLAGPGLLVRWKRSRSGSLTPSWQIRNELDGPHVDGISRFGKRSHETFDGAQRAWKDSNCHLTWETLRARASKSSRRYVSLREYETESIGFGSGQGRFVLSLTYLDRHLALGPG